MNSYDKFKDELNKAVKYKIHAITSVNGVGRSANNNVFYDTFEEAEAKVLQYIDQGKTESGFVIMKTVAIYKPQQPPVSTYLVRDSGRIELESVI